ncbi:Kae1-associated serine/threonine protein kinase [Candidatus Pacearchaeota archaeon]|nr:Kae1-associated serine/threonine protein kinase [Candidatus Pacearchaeota archaeon]
MKPKILFRGAEADITIYERKNWIFKDRKPKSYRIKEIDDKIRKSRTKSEAKLIEKASKVIPTPKIESDFSNKDDFRIIMENIEGKKLSEYLESFNDKKQKEILNQIGENLAKIHDIDIIHGDLTTSNMIFKEKVYFIDFGLGFVSNKDEDKAVDLHLLKQALDSKHFKHSETFFNEIIKGYKISKTSTKVLERFKKVEQRGRYKEQY